MVGAWCFMVLNPCIFEGFNLGVFVLCYFTRFFLYICATALL